uniref:Nuclear pore complex protein Nup98-Nup96 n=1 Tax=Caenorhabditis tropicalis TaxID=1561998 RepID=A0A1I7TES5_9PELO
MFGQNKSFGSGSFGASSGSGLFGQNTQNKGLFGQTTNQNTTTSSIFGSTQNKPASSLFGGASTTTSNLFGSPQTQNNQSSLFGGGQTNANRSLFGGASTSTTTGGSLFGGTSNTSNTGTSSLFGSNNNAAGSNSLFGGASGSAVTGTTIKFEPPINSDTMMRNGTTTTISTKHMCISAMIKYQDKSMEELRVEDYMANRKAPAAGTTTTGGGLFGNSTNTNQTGGGLFGNSNATQQKSSLFGGTSTASPFGGTSTNTGGSLFGNTNANTSGTGGSLFGPKPSGTSLFGNNTATTAGGSTFGQSTGSSLFGSTQQQSGSLFGQTQQPQQTGSLFGGNTATTGNSLFGQNSQPQQSTGFTFGGGSTTTNAFGQPAAANTGGSLFGNASAANTGGSLFGPKPATSTGFTFGGSQPTTTNAFGATNATGGGLFGNTAKPGGLFGNTTSTTTGGGLFGSQPQATTGGLFGSNTQSNQPLNAGFGNLAQPQVIVQQQVAPVPVIGVAADVLQMQANMKSLQSQLTNTPYGDSPLLKYNKETDAKESPMSTQQRQLRFLAAKKGSLSNGTPESSFIVPPISKVMSDISPALSKTNEVVKDLNYTSREAPPTLGRGLRNSTYNPNLSLANQSVHDSSALNRTIDSTLNASLNGTSNRLGPRGSVKKSNLKQLDLSVLSDTSRMGSVGRENRTADPDALPRISDSERRTDHVASTPSAVDPVQAVMQRQQERNRDPPSLNLDTTCDEHTGLEPVSATSSVTSVATTPSEEAPILNTSIGVRLSKPDYFSLPTINEMKGMVKNGRVVLEDGLTIGRSSYGSVFWPGRIELKNIVLDEVVVFRHKEVTVYPDEEQKPEEGQELNRPAEVTLERVWYTDKKTKKEVRDVVKLAEVGWREHLERNTIRMGATFKDYRAETGSWVFRVEHFSKYGLADDDDEPMEIAPPQTQLPAAPLQAIDMNSSISDVNTQVQRKKIHKTTDAHLREALQRSSVSPTSSTSSPDSHPDAIPIVRRRNFAGLGGVTSLGSENNRISNNMDEFRYRQQTNQSVIQDLSSYIIEEGEQPEKKPKLEILNDLEYESNRFIRNMQELKVMPKAKDPEHQFHGGSRASRMIGYNKSKLLDMGLVKGRTSRVGWSETGCLAWSAQPNYNQILFGTIDRASDVNEVSSGFWRRYNEHFGIRP